MLSLDQNHLSSVKSMAMDLPIGLTLPFAFAYSRCQSLDKERTPMEQATSAMRSSQIGVLTLSSKRFLDDRSKCLYGRI